MTHQLSFRWLTARPGWPPAALSAVVLAIWLCGPGAAAGQPATSQPSAPADAPATHEGPAAAPADPGHTVAPATDHGAQQPGTAAPAASQGGHESPSGHGAAAEHGEGAEHGESIWATLSRVANFAILAGGLFYLLRSPLAKHLAWRAEQIRGDLLQAAHTRTSAAAELKDIEDRLAALPAEIDALRARGKSEVDAEQRRIQTAAGAERERLLEQTRREVEQHLAAARRTLRHEAADLAVSVARTRLAREITDADRLRMVDRYVSQVKAAHD
jgi:F-type H+-transporting ATPase subunit b